MHHPSTAMAVPMSTWLKRLFPARLHHGELGLELHRSTFRGPSIRTTEQLRSSKVKSLVRDFGDRWKECELSTAENYLKGSLALRNCPCKRRSCTHFVCEQPRWSLAVDNALPFSREGVASLIYFRLRLPLLCELREVEYRGRHRARMKKKQKTRKLKIESISLFSFYLLWIIYLPSFLQTLEGRDCTTPFRPQIFISFTYLFLPSYSSTSV